MARLIIHNIVPGRCLHALPRIRNRIRPQKVWSLVAHLKMQSLGFGKQGVAYCRASIQLNVIIIKAVFRGKQGITKWNEFIWVLAFHRLLRVRILNICFSEFHIFGVLV